MEAGLRQRLQTLQGSEPIGWHRIERGFTPAQRWLVRFADGSRAFAKVGATPLTAEFLLAEQRSYQQLSAPFMPRLLGYDADPGCPVLLLEDLSAARWPPPWQPGDLALFVHTMQRVAATRPLPDDLLPLTHDFGATGSDERGRAGWAEVARDPGPFLGLGLCSAEWLNRALPRLRAAQNAAVVEGDDLVHNDVRSDNLCLTPDRGMLLIDWNLPRRGNGAFDLAFAAPSVHMEGGPLPEAWVDDDGRMAAIVSGYFAGRAGLPQIPDAPRVRWIQLEQLRVALPWAARALGLGPLDGDAP